MPDNKKPSDPHQAHVDAHFGRTPTWRSMTTPEVYAAYARNEKKRDAAANEIRTGEMDSPRVAEWGRFIAASDSMHAAGRELDSRLSHYPNQPPPPRRRRGKEK